MKCKHLIVLSGIFFMSYSIFGQGIKESVQAMKKKKADEYFDSYSYGKSIPLYKELIMMGDSSGERRIAEAYRKLGKVDSAEVWYRKLMNYSEVNAEDMYHYSEILKINKKYKEADEWLVNYKEKKKEDSRAKRKLANNNYSEMAVDKGQFNLFLITKNEKNADFGAALWNNKIVFASSREIEGEIIKRQYNWDNQPFLDMYVADRKSDGQLTTPKQFHKELNTRYHEGPACFNMDGSQMYFTRNNYYQKKAKASQKGVNHLMIFIAQFNATDSTWSPETPFAYNNDEYSVGHPSLSYDGNKLYFASDMPGGFGGTDIYVSEKQIDGQWGTPKNLGETVNTEGNEMFPFINSEEGILFFASNGHHSLGGLDVYMCYDKKGAFNEVIHMGAPINTSKDDFAFITDKKMKYGYLSSNRDGGKGDDDLYGFNILKPFKISYFVRGKALNLEDKSTPVPGSKVQLKDANNDVVAEYVVGDDGKYEFEIEIDKTYELFGTKEKYFSGNNSFSSENMKEEVIEKDIYLEKDPGLSLYCLIMEKGSEKPIENAHVILVDNFTNEEFLNLKTPESGDFKKALKDKKIGERLSYQIKLECPGYLGKTLTFNHKIDKPGQINLHEYLGGSIELDKIEVGADIGKLIDINPIYFDLNKSNIREDAAVELDKIVKVMKENPTLEIELQSHTDCRASRGYNQALSDRRAKSSAKYVQEHIENANRIYGKGYGESQLVNKCECEGSKKVPCTEEEHQQNRRTEFKIVKM